MKRLIFYFLVSLFLFSSFTPQASADEAYANSEPSLVTTQTLDAEANPPEHINPNYQMMPYSQLGSWLENIAVQSNRVDCEVIGQSAGGRNIYEVIVAAPSVHGKFGKYKELRTLMMKDPLKAKEQITLDPDYKVPIFINNSVHGGETTGVDASIKLIEELAFADTPEVQKILSNTIVIFNLCANPDGRVNGWRENDNGFDINRDLLTQSQPEAQAIRDIITEWKPMVTLDNHGYVDPILIEPCSMPHNANYETDLYLQWGLDEAIAMESLLTEKMPDVYPYALIPYRDFDTYGGWDDYSPIYIAQFAQYYALTTHTIEVGPRTYDGVLGHYWSNLGALLYAAENREAMFQDQLEIFIRGTNFGGPAGGEYPYAYIIPAAEPLQTNPWATADTIDYLIKAGVEVNTANHAFTSNGVTYPAGTYVVFLNQPLAGLANTLLWEGEDLSVDPGLPMYDISAWNLPELWGFKRAIVQEMLPIDTAQVKQATYPLGVIGNPSATIYALSSNNNNAIKAVNQLLARDINVLQMQTAENGLPAGTFIIQVKPNNATLLQDLATQYGFSFQELGGLPTQVKALPKQLKVAVLTTEYGLRATTTDSGYSELTYVGPLAFVLKQLGFDVQVIWPDDVEQNALQSFDILVGSEALNPATFTAAGWTNLQSFFANGGKYIGYGSGGAVSARNLGLLTSTIIARYGNGIANLNYNQDHPITASYAPTGTSFFETMMYLDNLGTDVEVLASFTPTDIFMAGYWPVENRVGFAGKPVIVKNDTAVIFGLDPVFRAHPKDSFRLLGNAIYNLTAK